MSRRIFLLGTVVLAMVVSLSFALTAMSADDCKLKNSGFRASVSTSVYNGPPPIPVCLVGFPIVKVDVTITRRGISASTSQLRCGALSDPVTLSLGGREHLIAPDSGYNWRGTLVDCGALIYKVN